VKSSCCRSFPRCSSCPVIVAARARGRFTRDVRATTVTEIIGGAPLRELPSCVREALVMLDERRSEPPAHASA
jgi:hypothetical protein